MTFVAVLVSGPINRIIVYESKSGKVKAVAAESFPVYNISEDTM